MTPTRSARPLVALAIVALIGAGCSNDSEGKADTAVAGTSTTTASKAVRFAECMRDHGVSGFPDPDASGGLTVDAIANGSSLDTDGPAWKAAIAACRDLQPAGFTGHRRSARQQQGALAFAQCIRDHGVEDFPDPTGDSPLVDTNRIPSAAGSSGMSRLNAAMQTCRELAAAAGVSGP